MTGDHEIMSGVSPNSSFDISRTPMAASGYAAASPLK